MLSEPANPEGEEPTTTEQGSIPPPGGGERFTFGLLACLVIAGIVIAAIAVRHSDRPVEKPKDDGEKAKVEKSKGDGQRAKAPAVSPELLTRGRALFGKQCSGCHGDKGYGDGEAAFLLSPKPRDFTELKFRLVSTSGGVPTVEDLFDTISRGMPGSAMPPWAHLSETDRWALAHTVLDMARQGRIDKLVAKGISRKKAIKGTRYVFKSSKPIELPPETPVSADGLARGRRTFVLDCARCHGMDGTGEGATEDLKTDLGHPIKARDFTGGIFKARLSGRQIPRRLMSGIPGTPMPNFRSSFTPEQLWDVVHYIQSIAPHRAEEMVAQRQRSITVRRVKEVSADPTAKMWSAVGETYVALMPLHWRNKRIEGVLVRAVHDGKRLAFQLIWEDRVADRSQIRHQDFSDAAAVQLTDQSDPPFFAMGSKEGHTNIWLWRSSWAAEGAPTPDVEKQYPRSVTDIYMTLDGRMFSGMDKNKKRPAQVPAAKHDRRLMTGWGAGNPLAKARKGRHQRLVSQGLGTLTARKPGLQDVSGRSDYSMYHWQVTFVRDLGGTGEGAVTFEPGKSYFVGFAVWDGQARDRNGQKSVTIWHRLKVEE